MNVFQELNRIDWKNNPGAASASARIVLSLLILAVIGTIGYMLIIKPQIEETDGLVAQEAGKLSELKTKQQKAANLEALTRQLDDINLMLEQRIKQLPSKTQMAELVVDISQEALAAGIQNDRFEPLGEINKEFYAERPISLKMIGTYHQFGQFISGIANLPRVVILTMHDISLKPAEATGNNRIAAGTLVLEGTVKTYRYLDPDEAAAATAPPGAKPPQARAAGGSQ